MLQCKMQELAEENDFSVLILTLRYLSKKVDECTSKPRREL